MEIGWRLDGWMDGWIIYLRREINERMTVPGALSNEVLLANIPAAVAAAAAAAAAKPISV